MSGPKVDINCKTWNNNEGVQKKKTGKFQGFIYLFIFLIKIIRGQEINMQYSLTSSRALIWTLYWLTWRDKVQLTAKSTYG